MRREILSLGLALAALMPALARADVGPPAHLRVSEREPGRFVTQWRVPKVLPPKAVPVPHLPQTCEALGPFTVEEQTGAWLLTQDWLCDGGLAGEIVGLDFPFADFALTTVVRVDLLSGDRFAQLLTPGAGPWRLPEGTAAPDRLRESAQAVGIGARHVLGSWAHWPFLLVAGLLGGLHRAIRVVTAFTLGQILGVVLAVPFPEVGVVHAEIALGLTAAILAREALRPASEARRIAVMAGAGGLVHGLAIGALLAEQVGQDAAGIFMQLLTVLGMDAGHLAGAVVIATLAGRVVARNREFSAAGRGLAYAAGVAGMALALGLAVGGDATRPEVAKLDFAAPVPGTEQRAAPGTASRRVAPTAPEAPIQSFLVVEPFEVRHEVMLRPGRLERILGLNSDSVVEISDQADLTRLLAAFVLDGATVKLDGQPARGIAQRADFMTVDSSGALPRTTPVPEHLDDAAVGVIIAYPTEGMPNRVSLHWEPFPAVTGAVPVALIDPESTLTATLTAFEPVLTWENNLVEDPIPAVVAVQVEPLRVPLPLLSLPLLAGAIVLLIAGLRKRSFESSLAGTRVLLALALVVAPFVQPTLALPASAAGAPSERQARRILAGLLPNIYRAMEFREEGLIFDRLAVSVTGDTLTEVYLEQRRTLEMEERGGAQARVEAVEILSAGEIERKEPGFGVRATWTAAGMVTHFGHRHFRQNRYDARLTIVPVDDSWKIHTVEILEQDRLK